MWEKRKWRRKWSYKWLIIEWDVKAEIKRLKKMKKGCNNIEINRIDIVILLLNKQWIRQIVKLLKTGDKTITKTKNSYKEWSKDFHKTNYKWRKSIYDEEIKKAEELIEEWWKNNKWYSILEMSEELWFWRERKGYNKTWHILRKRMNCWYQKPYVKDKKAPKNNKNILKKTVK